MRDLNGWRPLRRQISLLDAADAPPTVTQFTFPALIPSLVSREEFEALKRDVEEMKALLKRAKDYDERNNEPSCEMEAKMELLRKVAAAVGVSLDDVIGAKQTPATGA